MTELNSGPEAERGATAAQLKHDIDSGRTGDKVAGFDPAASPLGTDDEAAGVPPTPETIAHARAQERAGRPDAGGARANAATPSMAPDARMRPQGGLSLAILAGVALAAVLGVLLYAVL